MTLLNPPENEALEKRCAQGFSGQLIPDTV